MIEFSPGLNYVIGGNGHGKTSILEAIYFLCTTKNFKSSSDVDVVSFQEDSFEINGGFQDATTDQIRVYYSASERQRYYFQNEKRITRAADVIGKYPVVILTPDDHTLTQGYAGDRRKFVDSVISQASEGYLKTLLDYNKTLRQRSYLLNQIKERYTPAYIRELDAWSEKLVNSGLELISYRRSFISEFKEYITEAYQVIMQSDEVPDIFYRYLDESPQENIRTVFEEKLSSVKNDEIRRSTNLVGPHKDDLIFHINDLPLKVYGSQGQHKTFQVALRFAQFFYMKEKVGRVPIFLLDDVFGELDTARSRRISEYLKDVGQAFITMTDFTNIDFLHRNDDDKIITVKQGSVHYGKEI